MRENIEPRSEAPLGCHTRTLAEETGLLSVGQT
jgi:hypothetical protein